MPTVFVVQETQHNIHPARDYGELRIMLFNDDIMKGPDRMVAALQKELKEINSEDYILCIGDPVAIGIALHIALINTSGEVNVLTWDKRRLEYDESTIRID